MVDHKRSDHRLGQGHALFTIAAESGRNVTSCGWIPSLSTSPDEVLLANIRVLLLDVFVNRMATSHCFCKLASAGGR